MSCSKWAFYVLEDATVKLKSQENIKCAQQRIADDERIHMQVHTAHTWESVSPVVKTRRAARLWRWTGWTKLPEHIPPLGYTIGRMHPDYRAWPPVSCCIYFRKWVITNSFSDSFEMYINLFKSLLTVLRPKKFLLKDLFAVPLKYNYQENDTFFF